MPETTETPHPTAAEINTEIRALWAAGALPVERRSEYEVLLVAWAEAMRAEQELAA